MKYEELIILLPCHSLEDFPLYHEGEEAQGLLANWVALWHPALVAAAGAMTFRAPCETRWPALRLAREVMQAGGLAGAVFNGAKERALDHFIGGRLGFMEMAALVEEVLDRMLGSTAAGAAVSLDNVMAVDQIARREADARLETLVVARS